MRTKRLTITALLIVAAGGTACLLHSPLRDGPDTTTEVAKTVRPSSGGFFVRQGNDFTGCGWSAQPDTAQAVAQVAKQATPPNASADLSIVYYSPERDANQVLAAIHRSGRSRRIFGETTYGGILLPDGYHAATTGVIGMLALRNAEAGVGVGGATFDEASPAQAAALAYQRALTDAARPGQQPKLILLAVTLPHEEQVLQGLSNIAPGAQVRLVGGTAAGSVDAISRRKLSNWSILANNQVIHNGVAMALLFSPHPFPGSYGGGYRRSTVGGVVTQAQDRLILEIDHRPAAEVYDQWLGGSVSQQRRRGQDVVTYCTFYPLCRITGHYNQFVRVWPADDPAHPGALRTGGAVTVGETLYLSEGTWDLLMNHFASVPRLARESTPGVQPAAGLIVYCGGALPCIPEDERPQMAALVNLSLNHIPWIGVFTWGEQGSVSGAGYLHSSLTASTVLFPATPTESASNTAPHTAASEAASAAAGATPLGPEVSAR